MKKSLLFAVTFACALTLVRCGGTTTPAGSDGGTKADVGSATTGDVGSPDVGTAAVGDSGTAADTGTASTPDTGTAATGDGGFTGACNPVGNVGCKAGEKCTIVDAQGTIGCAPNSGGATDYNPCMADSDCAGGYFCASDGTNPGECRAFCTKNADCPQAGGKEVCNTSIQPSTALVCSRVVSCDPIAQDCVNPAENCYVTNAGPACAAQNGTATTGQSCTTANGCPRGDSCLSSKCQTLCDLRQNPDGGQNPSCPAGKRCVGIAGAAPAGTCQ